MNRQDREIAKLGAIVVSGLLLIAIISFVAFSVYMYIKHPELGSNVQFKIGK